MMPRGNGLYNGIVSLNLTLDKVAAFKEIYRILRSNGGRMVISDSLDK
jgi:ubiquinone/menaquinone biosynthesis C-methylase UbiE